MPKFLLRGTIPPKKERMTTPPPPGGQQRFFLLAPRPLRELHCVPLSLSLSLSLSLFPTLSRSVLRISVLRISVLRISVLRVSVLRISVLRIIDHYRSECVASAFVVVMSALGLGRVKVKCSRRRRVPLFRVRRRFCKVF